MYGVFYVPYQTPLVVKCSKCTRRPLQRHYSAAPGPSGVLNILLCLVDCRSHQQLLWRERSIKQDDSHRLHLISGKDKCPVVCTGCNNITCSTEPSSTTGFSTQSPPGFVLFQNDRLLFCLICKQVLVTAPRRNSVVFMNRLKTTTTKIQTTPQY